MRSLVALLLVAACGGGNDDRGERAGAALGRGVAAIAGGAELAPMPCARLALAGAPARTFEAGGASWRIDGDVLATDAAGRELVLGVVADARGSHDDTVANLAAARAAFVDAGVHLVVVLGGMAAERDELESLLGALLDQRWPLVAMPGDREPAAALAAAVAALGERVIDGSQVRLVRARGAAIGTLPGAWHPAQLPAASAGCLATAGDASALASRLGGETNPVVVSYAPPRQRGPGASDRTLDGVHVGVRELTSLLSGVPLVLSAMVDDAALGAPSDEAARAAPLRLAAGAIDGLGTVDADGREVRGMALVVRIGRDRVRWRRLRFDRGKLVAR